MASLLFSNFQAGCFEGKQSNSPTSWILLQLGTSRKLAVITSSPCKHTPVLLAAYRESGIIPHISDELKLQGADISSDEFLPKSSSLVNFGNLQLQGSSVFSCAQMYASTSVMLNCREEQNSPPPLHSPHPSPGYRAEEKNQNCSEGGTVHTKEPVSASFHAPTCSVSTQGVIGAHSCILHHAG